MVQFAKLISDLQQLQQVVLADLQLQPQPLPPTGQPAATTSAGNPSTTESDDLDRHAAGWVLSSLFVRYAEDHGLLTPADPTDNPSAWWSSRWSDLAVALGTTPDMLTPAPPETLARPVGARLAGFWRDRPSILVDDGADAKHDTRLFSDLYQDLSQQARVRHALLQTPDFVVQFILDQTLEPAISTFDLDDFKVLDPMCGSGTFLLDAFERLLEHWAQRAPGMGLAERTHRALASLHGSDIDLPAALITRFRLLLAAHSAAGNRPANAPPASWPLRIAVGDALLGTGGDLDRHPDLLNAGSYHVVVGNPPYLVVTDRVLDVQYRQRYDTCVGKYALTVPFLQRCFELARKGDGEQAGYVGLLSSNSFTKRDFGRKMVEDFLAHRVTLTQVIDTSGAHIPGHGAPTMILIGRNRPGSPDDPVVLVAGRHGEPAAPIDPAQGHVWQAIIGHAGNPGHADQWIEVGIRPRGQFRSHPWSLSSSTAAEVMARLSGGQVLGAVADRIGYLANTGADDVFTGPPGVWRRQHTESHHVVGIVTGSDVRDWLAPANRAGFFPRDAELRVIDIRSAPGHHRRLWPMRTTLRQRSYYGTQTFASGNRAWYDWHSVSGIPTRSQHRIAFAWVATHTHFAMLGANLALPSAPVIEVPPDTSPQAVHDLLALLNSSTVCFWLKQVSNVKGTSSIHRTPGTNGEPWQETYEYTPGRLRDLPLPAKRSTRYGSELAELAEQLADSTPAAIIASGHPTPRRLDAARDHWEQIRAKMIALAEEQDWEIYHQYGLLNGPRLATHPSAVPPLQLGERAFEIALARRSSADTGLRTEWFARHGSQPITDLPAYWPREYRDLVEARIGAIATDPHLELLERPETKRRWATVSWEQMQAEALHGWLLDRCEAVFADDQAGHPRARTVGWLADVLRGDPEIADAARLIGPDQDLADVLAALLADEHVPYLPALRYRDAGIAKHSKWASVWARQRTEDAGGVNDMTQSADQVPAMSPGRYTSGDFMRPSYWRLRGKNDMPTERFVSYLPFNGQASSLHLGWAGWRDAEHAHAITELVKESLASDTTDQEIITVLLAGLAEALMQTRDPEGPTAAVGASDRLKEWLDRFQLTMADLTGWRPRPPRRGRPPKRPS